jgi:metal-dependent amidase/aminoacylase/carboxypeptidase family protein
MAPSLKRVAAARFDADIPVTTTSEDFSLFLQKAPGFMFFLGVAPKGSDPTKVEPNHSPRFFIDESALVTGVRALSSVAVDYLAGVGK